MEAFIVGAIFFVAWLAVMAAAVVSSPKSITTSNQSTPNNRPMVLTNKEGR